jgi:hypothetical protein
MDRNSTRWRVECCNEFLYEGADEGHARLLYTQMASHEDHTATLSRMIPAWTVLEASDG